jgi:DNA-binding response OmpR family regulator
MADVWLVEDDVRLRASLASILDRSGVTLTEHFGSVAETRAALRRGPVPNALKTRSRGSPMTSSVARRAVRQLQPEPASNRSFQLTQRERDVLELLCASRWTRGSFRCVTPDDDGN